MDASLPILSFTAAEPAIYSNGTRLVPDVNGLKQPIALVSIIISSICLVSFAAMTVASHFVKDRKVRWCFKTLCGLMWTMTLCVLLRLPAFSRHRISHPNRAFARTLGDEVARALFQYLPSFYIFMPILKSVLANVPDTILLYVVYGVIQNGMDFITFYGTATETTWLTLFFAHKLILPTVMLLFGIADTCVYLYGQVLVLGITNSSSSSSSSAVNLSGAYACLHLAYVAAYLAVAIEILVCAIFIFRCASLSQTRSKVCKPLSPTLTLLPAISSDQF